MTFSEILRTSLISVYQAAKHVYTLFGPESTAQQSIDQKTVDVDVEKKYFYEEK